MHVSSLFLRSPPPFWGVILHATLSPSLLSILDQRIWNRLQPLALSLEEFPPHAKLSMEELSPYRGYVLPQASTAHHWEDGGHIRKATCCNCDTPSPGSSSSVIKGIPQSPHAPSFA